MVENKEARESRGHQEQKRRPLHPSSIHPSFLSILRRPTHLACGTLLKQEKKARRQEDLKAWRRCLLTQDNRPDRFCSPAWATARKKTKQRKGSTREQNTTSKNPKSKNPSKKSALLTGAPPSTCPPIKDKSCLPLSPLPNQLAEVLVPSQRLFGLSFFFLFFLPCKELRRCVAGQKAKKPGSIPVSHAYRCCGLSPLCLLFFDLNPCKTTDTTSDSAAFQQISSRFPAPCRAFQSLFTIFTLFLPFTAAFRASTSAHRRCHHSPLLYVILPRFGKGTFLPFCCFCSFIATSPSHHPHNPEYPSPPFSFSAPSRALGPLFC